MRDEIGSEFWNIPLSQERSRLFPENTKWFVSGTAALEYILEDILRERSIRSAAVPSWCCSCMIDPFLKRGIRVVFYPVAPDGEGRLLCDYRGAQGADLTLAIYFFGYCSQRNIGAPQGIVIQDLSHSLFSEAPLDGDYFFGSLRKWAGFCTGGYAWSRGGWREGIPVSPLDQSYLSLRKTAMRKKLAYLNGEIDDKSYLDDYAETERFLDVCGIMDADPEDVDRAARLDVCFLRQRRRENARVLLEKLRGIALFPELGEGDCPLFVPILLPREKRDALRRFLIGRGVYLPIHWEASPNHRLNDVTRVLYDHELSVVCDQRYSQSDMRRILREMESFPGIL